jgi:hypothetical protein
VGVPDHFGGFDSESEGIIGAIAVDLEAVSIGHFWQEFFDFLQQAAILFSYLVSQQGSEDCLEGGGQFVGILVSSIDSFDFSDESRHG